MGDLKLSAKVALKLLAVGGLAASTLAVPGIAVAYTRLSKEWDKYKKGDIGRIVKRFHKQSLVKITEKNGETIIELSDKGKSKVLQSDFEKINLEKRLDGKIHVVIFDIPRVKNLARDTFRRKLKELGFKMVQRSVFITFYRCQREIEFMVHFLGIENEVILIQATKFEVGPKFEFLKYQN